MGNRCGIMSRSKTKRAEGGMWMLKTPSGGKLRSSKKEIRRRVGASWGGASDREKHYIIKGKVLKEGGGEDT